MQIQVIQYSEIIVEKKFSCITNLIYIQCGWQKHIFNFPRQG